MSKWRQKAIECLPECKREFEQPDTSIYMVFFELLPAGFTHGLGVNFYFGGTSLLIVVGVALDLVRQIETHLVARQYEGLLA